MFSEEQEPRINSDITLKIEWMSCKKLVIWYRQK